MSQTAILYPVFAQVALTVIVAGCMGRARYEFLKSHKDRENLKELAIGRGRWSDEAMKASRNFSNQFEMPTLFYAVVAFSLITRSADTLMLGLAWVFVASRIVHSMFQLGSNVVPRRFAAYAVGAVTLLAMWVVLGVRVATASP